MTERIVTFGEIMLRLKSPGAERLLQSPILEATFGGGEANVSVSLGQFGLNVAFVTVLPKNPIGEMCVSFLKGKGVDTSMIIRSDGRMGLYFFESGANQRPSKVVYDRTHSVIMEAPPSAYDWREFWMEQHGFTSQVSPRPLVQTTQRYL